MLTDEEIGGPPREWGGGKGDKEKDASGVRQMEAILRGRQGRTLKPVLVCKELPEGGYECTHFEDSDEKGNPRYPALAFSNKELGVLEVKGRRVDVIADGRHIGIFSRLELAW